MSEPFAGEVKLFAFGFAPRNYAFAAGQVIPIQQNTVLYALFGRTFGGNGTTNFALPNLVGRQACGLGQSPDNTRRDQGAAFGTFAVTLTQAEMPAHNHGLSAYRSDGAAGQVATPTTTTAIGHSGFGTFDAFAPLASTQNFAAVALTTEGGGQPHPNAQPFLGLTYAVALQGTFPQRP